MENISNENFEQLKISYNEMIVERRNHALKIWAYIFIAYAGVMVGLVFVFPKLFFTIGGIFYIVYGSIAGALLIVFLFLIIFIKSTRPIYTLLINNIIKNINEKNNSFYTYIFYPKNMRYINQNGGLFYRSCSMNVRYMIKGQTKDNTEFSVLNTRVFTSNGKSTTTYFDGNYIVINKGIKNKFQIKTKYKPYLKDIKLQKIDNQSIFKIYVEDTGLNNDFYKKYGNLMEILKNKLSAYNIYLGTTDNEVHFAYENNLIKIKNPKELTMEYYNTLQENIENVLNLPNIIMEIIGQDKTSILF